MLFYDCTKYRFILFNITDKISKMLFDIRVLCVSDSVVIPTRYKCLCIRDDDHTPCIAGVQFRAV